MSIRITRNRLLGVVLLFSVGILFAGCSGYSEDPGAKRSQQQSVDLQNRIKTTQVDR